VVCVRWCVPVELGHEFGHDEVVGDLGQRAVDVLHREVLVPRPLAALLHLRHVVRELHRTHAAPHTRLSNPRVRRACVVCRVR
jgi:hypothetical protein